ncbi:MAG: hypothetical protein MJ174_00450 [Treponema sp.]|nr:hypothetical protein [Treponema sp.]
MTNEDVLKALKQIKTYTAADSLDELEFAIEVIQKLEDAGVKEPLKADFSKLTK